MVQLRIGNGKNEDEDEDEKELFLRVGLNIEDKKYAKKLALKRGDTLIFFFIINIFFFINIEPLFNVINNIYNSNKINEVILENKEQEEEEENIIEENSSTALNTKELEEGKIIIERLKELNHEIYKDNIIYIKNYECKKNDSWCDTLFIVTNDGKIEYKATGTIQAGSSVYKRPLNPAGVFQINEGQHKNKWNIGQHCGAYSGRCHEALKQIQAISGTRSKTEDRKNTIPVNGIFGINIHGGLENPSKNSPVGLNSAGCLVTKSMNDHRNFMELVKKFNKDTFTISVISFND